MDQVVAQALTTYNQLTTKPVVQLAANVNGSASNLSSSNGVVESPAAASLEVAVNGNGNGNGNGKSASK
jgi:UDP-galactopyranose mutase